MNEPEQLNENEAAPRCRQCDRAIQMGEDCLQLQPSVMGPRGLVDLADPIPFCSETCLSAYASGADEQIRRLARRIP